MDDYTLHFLVALLIANVLLFLLIKGKSRLLGLVVVPLLSYTLFYDPNLSLLSGWTYLLIGYFGSFFVAFFFFALTRIKRNVVYVKKKSSLWIVVILLVAELLLLTFIEVVPWAVNTFPLADADTTMFALLAPIESANDFVFQTLKDQVFFRCGLIFLCLLVLQGLIAKMIRLFSIRACLNLGRCSFCVSGENFTNAVLGVVKFIVYFLLGCFLSKMLVIPCIVDSSAFMVLLGKGIDISFEEESVDSPFYKEHYEDPLTAEPPEGKGKNLVVIFLESMANNYQKYTPEINEWKKKGLSFTPGGESIAGTSWTIAGITSSLCGLPLTIPAAKSELKGELPTYLPKAVCLMDLLKGQDYNQVFVQGSNADFTQKRQFWNVHGNVKIVDELALKKNGKIPKNYNVFWGVEDKRTFLFAKEELTSMAKSEKPFAAYLLTVDTHLPEGFLDSSCHYNESTPFQNVLRCSSYLIGDFLDWMSQQDWFDNTVVFVVGDHVMPTLSLKAGVDQEEKLYTTAILINANNDVSLNRKFSNLDYTPTILEAMGWKLENHAFGLGRSLISSDSTLLEILGRNYLDSVIKQRSVQYDGFLFGKK